MGQLTAKWEEEKQKQKQEKDPWASKRRYYRKDTDLQCIYRPVNYSPKVTLMGYIKDISLGGVKLEVIAKDAIDFSHEPGDTFYISTVLPNGKKVDLSAKIVSSGRDQIPGKFSFGMSFFKLTDLARKNLGFFLMPA